MIKNFQFLNENQIESFKAIMDTLKTLKFPHESSRSHFDENGDQHHMIKYILLVTDFKYLQPRYDRYKNAEWQALTQKILDITFAFDHNLVTGYGEMIEIESDDSNDRTQIMFIFSGNEIGIIIQKFNDGDIECEYVPVNGIVTEDQFVDIVKVLEKYHISVVEKLAKYLPKDFVKQYSARIFAKKHNL